MELAYKQFVKRFFIAFSILISVIIGFVYLSDPYVYYHKDGIYKRTFIKNFNMRYQIPGMIRNLEYETLFMGTSMVHNFKEESMNQKLGTTSFNASISGSSAREQKHAVELAIASQNIKHVFWEINFDSLAGKSDRVDATFPAYLYDRNVLNDLPYLLSYDAFKKIEHQLKNQENVDMNANPFIFYKFGDKKPPLTIEQMNKETEGLSAPPFNMHNQDSYMESFNRNMLDLVKENPDIQFTFLYTPYPVTRHVVVDENAPSITEERMKTKVEVFKELSHYENAEVYDFQDEEQITFNVGNYMDRSHYFTYINDWMLKQMVENEPIQNLNEYNVKIERLTDQIRNFNSTLLVEKEHIVKK